ncbi:J domain-containing protein DDB_G0295729-like isoform X3 [Hylaeus anthracinus]|uniref:J domain-containing protein DDB_G0295729-like isoform X3 n=1 Tax=Hylaeus anthracinus TaxID=313031 RepID=UPI0023B8F4A8|nr:J domain-containing protein DDB_G0295729-like isoform X3 [Hylaeus anthracinus]XP_054005585.1 J domain-containing protein DDB_G0295729-like isoform X3 [Hylaeus anthracinus]
MSCRRKIDSKLWLDYTQAMETEVRTLKQELVRTQEALKTATRRCRDLVKELDNRTTGHESERTLRDQQLSRILRALLVLEARLKQEQKSIRQLLCEKDNVIRNQQLEIARLRRYTKNYIKCKREQTLISASMKIETTSNIEECDLQASSIEVDSRQDSGISKDIRNLKCEIITKLSPSVVLEDLDRGVKKTHSFAGSDISKTSLTSSENTDVSIITTTTEGSPSLLSTEGFCEGESTDVSPGSTLNKSSRYTPTMVTDSENETTMIYDDNDDEITITESCTKLAKKRIGVGRSKTQKACKTKETIEAMSIARTESKDDGMDCNFASEDEEKEQEPIYVNACNETISRNTEHAGNTVPETSKTNEDYSNNNSTNDNGSNNNNDSTVSPKMEMEEEQTVEETSGNWYSDPDEDRINDDVFRHSTYRPNSNHNSVLECVNQILLRDMEEEENIMSVPRRFKHRGRIVRFQPARLSDIESVGSEMERKNSEEAITEKEVSSNDFNDVPASSFEPTATEDEFGMSLAQTVPLTIANKISNHESSLEESEESKAIPIVIIEPKVEVKETRHATFPSPQTSQKTKTSINATNPPLKLERIEEKTCLQMSTKGLTIAKNLDYEDIESLPEIISPPPKTPPALPPKPQFKNNTLILKKIPSPSFLIDETRKKQPLLESSSSEHGKKIFGFISSPLKSAGINVTSARSLNFEEAINKVTGINEEGNFWRNRFNNVRSSFRTRQNHDTGGEQTKKIPRVTNIVRHFEEFKIGGETEDPAKERSKTKEKHVHPEFDQEFDIRQNFEEFNLDECNLSDDPDRPEGDGSERLGNLVATVSQNEKTAATKDNNNVPLAATNSSSGYDHFLEATGLSNKSILTPSRLLSNHKSMLKPKDVKYKNKIKATAVLEKHGVSTTNNTTHVRHWTGPFV